MKTAAGIDVSKGKCMVCAMCPFSPREFSHTSDGKQMIYIMQIKAYLN